MKSKNYKKYAIISFIFILAISFAATFFTACNREEGYEFNLSRNEVNRIFESLDQRFRLPDIVTDDPNVDPENDISWRVGTSSILGNPVAFLDSENDGFYTIGLIDAMHANTRRASTTFVATISGTHGTTTLHYTVNVRDVLTDYLGFISSSMHGHINYSTRGIARRRVFGLRDITLPECGTAAPGTFNDGVWQDGTWRDVDFSKTSSASFNLMWNYRGTPMIDVWIEQYIDGEFERLFQDDYSINDIARVIYDREVDERLVVVNFMNEGIVRVVAQARSGLRPGFNPRYEFIFDIVDAVNVYDFEDIKLIERLARYTYISDGIFAYSNGQRVYQNRTNGTQLTGAGRNGRSLGDYINPYNYNGLLSSHFLTTLTPTPARYFWICGCGSCHIRGVDASNCSDRRSLESARVNWDGYRDAGAFFNEFAHWAPSFRFEDIVIRTTHRDRNDATNANGRMETWAEGTWFFGSVWGNGNQLDATPYTRGAEGRYRNTHSMRGLADGGSLGFEGRRFFPGYGWGDIYAFYMLANHSVIDNLTLTGENIPQGNTAIRLNQYNKIGVLGTSMLGGRNRDFSLGAAHNNGIFTPGLYNADITIQNSIIEKGLTLVGAGFAPNGQYPITIRSSVMRFAGFTGILGASFGGGIGDDDPENGEAVRRAAQSLSYRDGQRIVHPQGGSFGNFIIARNNIFHDISVSPLLSMPARSGSHMSIEGNENHFFTWLLSNDIQFPEMTDPYHEGFARIMGGSINGMVPSLMNRVFTNNNNQGPPPVGRGHLANIRTSAAWQQTRYARYEQPNGAFRINIPVIIVTDEGQHKNNYASFRYSILQEAADSVVGLVSDHAGANTPRGLNQRFDLHMLYAPDNAPLHIRPFLERVADMNAVAINSRIEAITPAGLRTPTVLSGMRIELENGRQSTGVVTLQSAGEASLANHRIEFNGNRIDSEFDQAHNALIVRIEDLIYAGVDRFGIYTLNLLSTQTRRREPVSRFSIIVQGTNGGEAANVMPGSVGFYEANRFIGFELNLSVGDAVNSVILLGTREHPQNRPIDFVFNNSALRFEGSQLRNGENVVMVQTNSLILLLRQSVIRYTIALEVLPIDLRNNPPLVLNLIGNISMSNIGVRIGQTILSPTQFSRTGNTITIQNSIVQSILRDDYREGASIPITVSNDRGLNLSTNLIIIRERVFFSFAQNAITTPFNQATGMNSPFINIAPDHAHFTQIHIELVGHMGDNILGVSFVDTNSASEARAGMIRFDQMQGFDLIALPNGNTRLVVPASALRDAGLAAGQRHRIWVFSSIHAARTPIDFNQMLMVFNAEHDTAQDRAIEFVSDEFRVNLDEISGGVTIGFGGVAYLYDLLLEQTPEYFDLPEEILETLLEMLGPIIDLFESFGLPIPSILQSIIGYGRISNLPVIPSVNNKDFSHSTFDDEGAIFAIRNEHGQLLYEFTRCDIFTGSAPVSFNTIDLGYRVPPQMLEVDLSAMTDDDGNEIPFLSLLGAIVLPLEIPSLNGIYITGFTICDEFLLALGSGVFSIEVRNDFNVAHTTLVIE